MKSVSTPSLVGISLDNNVKSVRESSAFEHEHVTIMKAQKPRGSEKRIVQVSSRDVTYQFMFDSRMNVDIV